MPEAAAVLKLCRSDEEKTYDFGIVFVVCLWPQARLKVFSRPHEWGKRLHVRHHLFPHTMYQDWFPKNKAKPLNQKLRCMCFWVERRKGLSVCNLIEVEKKKTKWNCWFPMLQDSVWWSVGSGWACVAFFSKCARMQVCCADCGCHHGCWSDCICAMWTFRSRNTVGFIKFHLFAGNWTAAGNCKKKKNETKKIPYNYKKRPSPFLTCLKEALRYQRINLVSSCYNTHANTDVPLSLL